MKKMTKSLSIISSLFILMTMVSCTNDNNSNSISLDFNNCSKDDVRKYIDSSDYFEYSNYSFFTYENKDVVLKYDDLDNVCQYESFNKATLDLNNIALINKGDNIFDVVSKIGLPSYEGVQTSTSLDFAKSVTILCRITFDEDNLEMLVNNYEILDKDDPEAWFDENKTILPTLKMAKKVKYGMSLDEVVFILGKPQRDVGSGAFIYEYNLSDGQSFYTSLFNNDELEKEYEETHGTKIYGSYFLYVTRMFYGTWPNMTEITNNDIGNVLR
ncbi:MAG: hypothetical protein MR766_01525 [Erysipelotrichaceae bacterium]|nr:hypothetical protein [Erysipelotrichaceae bacterium]